jgi:hypothetical protein
MEEFAREVGEIKNKTRMNLTLQDCVHLQMRYDGQNIEIYQPNKTLAAVFSARNAVAL